MLAMLGEFVLGVVIGGSAAISILIIIAIIAAVGWMNSGSH